MMTLIRDWLLDPLALLFMASLLLLLWSAGRRQLSRLVAVLVLVLFLTLWMISSSPLVVNAMLRSAEAPVVMPVCEGAAAIVALGGGLDRTAASAHSYQAMHRATLARVVAAGELARSQAGLPMVLAGGGTGTVAESDVMRSWLVMSGLDPQRLYAERQSSNTRENANQVQRLLQQRLGVPQDAPVWLVTSALHMPRARAVFSAAGRRTCAVAVDHLALPDVPLWALMPQTTALVKFDRLLHEWVARVYYGL